MRINYDRYILIQLEVFVRACRSCKYKKRHVQKKKKKKFHGMTQFEHINQY